MPVGSDLASRSTGRRSFLRVTSALLWQDLLAPSKACDERPRGVVIADCQLLLRDRCVGRIDNAFGNFGTLSPIADYLESHFA